MLARMDQSVRLALGWMSRQLDDDVGTSSGMGTSRVGAESISQKPDDAMFQTTGRQS